MKRLVPLFLVVLLAACGYDATEVPPTVQAVAPSIPPVPEPPNCGVATRSYAPGGTTAQLQDGATVRQIRSRGRLVAGVSADSILLASRDPLDGNIKGFDIDMVNAVARAIFGPGGESRVQLRVITAAQRIDVLMDEQVDIVVRNMTINCDRWEQIAFSAVYYMSGQKVMVRSDIAKEVDDISDVDGLRVCAPDGTTSLANLVAEAPEAIPVTAVNHTGCLVKFQRGEADAITGDDTVLAGLAAQDPYAVVPAGQEPFTEEPYGIGVNAENVDLVRLINAALEELRSDGSWQDSYDRWFRPDLGDGTGQPQPTYGR